MNSGGGQEGTEDSSVGSVGTGLGRYGVPGKETASTDRVKVPDPVLGPTMSPNKHAI